MYLNWSLLQGKARVCSAMGKWFAWWISTAILTAELVFPSRLSLRMAYVFQLWNHPQRPSMLYVLLLNIWSKKPEHLCRLSLVKREWSCLLTSLLVSRSIAFKWELKQFLLSTHGIRSTSESSFGRLPSGLGAMTSTFGMAFYSFLLRNDLQIPFLTTQRVCAYWHFFLWELQNKVMFCNWL